MPIHCRRSTLRVLSLLFMGMILINCKAHIYTVYFSLSLDSSEHLIYTEEAQSVGCTVVVRAVLESTFVVKIVTVTVLGFESVLVEVPEETVASGSVLQ